MTTTVTTPTKVGYDLALKLLTKNPSLSFADVKAKVESKGGVIYPISYGRAKKQLGLAGPGASASASSPEKAPPTAPAAPAGGEAPKRRGRPPAASAGQAGALPAKTGTKRRSGSASPSSNGHSFGGLTFDQASRRLAALERILIEVRPLISASAED